MSTFADIEVEVV